jgi:hypothetical protein
MGTSVWFPKPYGSLWEGINKFHSMGGFSYPGGDKPIGRRFFVDGSNTSGLAADSNPGRSWDTPLLTMAEAFARIDNFDEINLMGVVREQLTAPLGVFDITIKGAGNTPRQATDGGIPTGGGSSWLAPTTPTALTPLLTLLNQGWSLQNFQMCADTDAPCVKLERRETALIPDSSHASFYGMNFTGGLYGLECIEVGFVNVIDSRFNFFTGATAYAIHASAGAGVAAPLQWRVINNIFRSNKNHILLPMSQGEFIGNDFGIVNVYITAVIALSLTGGLNNTVSRNYFNRPLNTSPNATLYVGGTGDLWYENYGTDGIFYGVPDNS